MRIWSLHPSLLDTKGLVALWRETLLAQKVLLNETTGYKNHPQLNRFKTSNNPIGAIATLVDEVLAANPGNVAEFKAGKEKAFNALVGQVMKAAKGKANPQQVNDLLKLKLEG